jgi:hypothetical protein
MITVRLAAGPIYMSKRERAVIVDQLQRMATNAVFAGELHSLWTGAF